ncbi:hypothetical protein Acr_17g0008660 [Actinidia rufa]|uniref:Uncharacterized protein n=1 Tax=Actinidia rufa TaxID=165716 RepID=A0A7J0G3D0_9ERIC|nr:hypothetical protein Acr_17g0008660 [Actinidia rufa]
MESLCYCPYSLRFCGRGGCSLVFSLPQVVARKSEVRVPRFPLLGRHIIMSSKEARWSKSSGTKDGGMVVLAGAGVGIAAAVGTAAVVSSTTTSGSREEGEKPKSSGTSGGDVSGGGVVAVVVAGVVGVEEVVVVVVVVVKSELFRLLNVSIMSYDCFPLVVLL